MNWLKDPKTQKESVTLTLLIIGFVVATVKMLMSGVEVGILKFGEFGGVEYSAALAALSGMYVLRKKDSIKKDKSSEE